jgi:quinol monooxygenase YgiN
MIIVTGTALARSDSFDEVLRISTEHVLRSRAEPGCISHAVFRDIEEPLRLQFVERWTDMAALKVHFGVPASRSFGDNLARLSAEPPSMTLYDAMEMKRER